MQTLFRNGIIPWRRIAWCTLPKCDPVDKMPYWIYIRILLRFVRSNFRTLAIIRYLWTPLVQRAHVICLHWFVKGIAIFNWENSLMSKQHWLKRITTIRILLFWLPYVTWFLRNKYVIAFRPRRSRRLNLRCERDIIPLGLIAVSILSLIRFIFVNKLPYLSRT